MVGVSAQKTVGRMTVDAFRLSVRVGAGRGVVGGGRLADAHSAVVAPTATTRNTRMIKATIQCQRQKIVGIMAVIAFDGRWQVNFRFTDGQYTVVAFTAISEYFQMINTWDNGHSQRGMAGLTHITGTEVIRQFFPNRTKLSVMTIHTI